MDIEKVLKTPRLARAITGMDKTEFDTLLVTFRQVLHEHHASKKRQRKVGGGAKGGFNIKSARNKFFFIL